MEAHEIGWIINVAQKLLPEDWDRLQEERKKYVKYFGLLKSGMIFKLPYGSWNDTAYCEIVSVDRSRFSFSYVDHSLPSFDKRYNVPETMAPGCGIPEVYENMDDFTAGIKYDFDKYRGE